jgi:hypothetical protein
VVEIPEAGPVFLAALAVHVFAGLASVLTGALAAAAPKRPGRHPRWGTGYLYGLSVVFVTAVVMSVLRWEHNRHLLGIAVVAYGLGLTGRWLHRHRSPRGDRPGRDGPHRWMLWHGVAMAGSYAALLTGFYVDNGERLPLWNQLPHLAYWVIPTTVGIPLTWWALVRNGALSRSRPTASRPAGRTSRRR